MPLMLHSNDHIQLACSAGTKPGAYRPPHAGQAASVKAQVIPIIFFVYRRMLMRMSLCDVNMLWNLFS